MDDQSRRTRILKGINTNLNPDFEWPLGFGMSSEPGMNSPKNNYETTEPTTKTKDTNEIASEVSEKSYRSSSKHSRVSATSSIDIQKKKLALEAEKKKHHLETKMLEIEVEKQKYLQQIKLVEMEAQVREAEITQNEERRSVRTRNSMSRLENRDLYPEDIVLSSASCKNQNITFVNSDNISHSSCVKSFVADWVEKVQLLDNEEWANKCAYKTPQYEKSEVSQLCETLNSLLKNVNTRNTYTPKNEKFFARHSVEKDFPIFDGRCEEWPTFIYSFKRISELCEYTDEEAMIKLQKCLRGEARSAVAGMLISPQNLDQVIETLKMRFGKPEQIIETLLVKVKSISYVKENDMENLISLSSHVSNVVSTIKSLNYQAHLQNPMILKEIVQKLPDMLKLRWGEEVHLKNGTVNLEDFSEWLMKIANAACYVSTSKRVISSSKSFPKLNAPRYENDRKFEKSFIVSSAATAKEKCTYCNGKGHKIDGCTVFKADDVDTRWKVVTDRKLCFSCLKNSHHLLKCRYRRSCGINNCTKPHNKYLHKDEPNKSTSNEQRLVEEANMSPESNVMSSNQSVLATSPGKTNVLLRMVKVKLHGPRNTIFETVALCDDASTVTLLDQSIVDMLKITGTVEPLCLQWTNDVVKTNEDSLRFDLKISGNFQGAKTFLMKNVRSVENLSLPYQNIQYEDWQQYSHLNGLPIEDIKSRPMILIGQDNIRLTVPRRLVQGPENLPIATKTYLGWILHGKFQGQKIRNHHTFHICDNIINEDELHQLVKKSFAIDAFGLSVASNLEKDKKEERAVSILNSTIQKLENRYQIGLLWKEDIVSLPESRSSALRRLYCVEKQMEKNFIYKQKYIENIRKYVEKGYARKLSREEAAIHGPRTWHLPHFGVINPNKPGKLRFVFDAAAKSHGISLNSCLLSGPDLLQPITAVLLKFRERKIAFSSDVREMFHQVVIRPEDRDSQRFLWRDGNRNIPPEVYQMQVMIFGATCSPTCAQFVKNLNAEQSRHTQRVIDAITKRHYVDDYLDCVDSPEEAFQLICQVRQVQLSAGFELVNWTTNSRDLRKRMSLDQDLKKDLNLDSDSTLQRVLGLFWDPTEDEFVFKAKIDQDYVETPTKRNILRIVMSVFDPLGLIVNFTVRGRILVQDIWRTGIGWDDHIDNETLKTWTSWLSDLQNIDKMTIPRCYSPRIPNASRVELHTFCDSSKKAFAAVVYIRVIEENDIDVALVSAKARVSPNKPLSIPRLELQAALMGSRLTKTVKEELDIKIDKIYYWTDSTTVLYWIQGDGKKLGQFEGHRVGEIQELTETSEWHWIPSKCNAADKATRTYNEDGSNATNFEDWFDGPKFLKQLDETTWPTKDVLETKDIHLEKEFEIIESVNITTDRKDTFLPEIEKFSDWSKLLRVTAWITKIIKIWISKIRQENCSRRLSLEDINEAETIWIQKCQQDSFPGELNELRKQKSVSRHSRLRTLTPMLNERSIIVLGGRTDLAPTMTESTKRPPILPKRHRFTTLFLKHLHEKFGHQGIETVFNESRQKYWIIDGRSAVKSVFLNCQFCKLKNPRPMIPLMGQMPAERLTPNVRPFTFTGMDFFGPFLVSVGRRKKKRWGVIFTCLSIRALHLDITHNMTTDSAIMAIRRMIARRGKPHQIFADNGTNIRGASEELKKALDEMDHKQIEDDMLNRGIEWKFIPPASPHMGGAWERLIRSVKKTFYTILREQQLKDELMLTLFAEIENMLNTRPITKISTDPDDLEALTPNHFLIGYQNKMNQLGTNYDLRKEWRKVQNLTNAYWKRWVKEYLPTFTKRNRWTMDNEPVKENDVVIVMEDNTIKSSWRLGRIVKVFPGPDGRVRVVEVKTKNGIFRRPVSKLGKVAD